MFNKRDYLKLVFENQEKEDSMQQLKEAARMEEQDKLNKDVNDVFEYKQIRESNEKKYKQFVYDTKKSLLSEAIYNIYDSALGTQLENSTEGFKRNLVNKFIEENGVDNLLGSFREKSYLLSEMARVVNKYTAIVIEKADKQDPNTFFIDLDDKDNFYDELKTDDAEEVASAIRLRVSSAMDEFIQNNMSDRAEIKEILAQSQEKVNQARTDEIKESYEILSKRKITNVREKRTKNVLESMIFNVSSAVVKNESMKEMYMKDGRLDMDSIVESCELMYTFLETVNSTKMVKVDEKYLDMVLTGLKA